jgi:hypothetical protein
MTDRFEKFTEDARRVLRYAQEEAQRFNHYYIGTEHLLLGLVREGDSGAAKVLATMGVELNKVRIAVEFIIGRGDRMLMGEIGLTPRANKVIELAIDEARRLNNDSIGTEHLLVGLVREGEGIAAGILESVGVSLETMRAQVPHVVSQVSLDESLVERPAPSESSYSSRLNSGPVWRDLDGESGLPPTAKDWAIVRWPSDGVETWLVNPDRSVAEKQVAAELTKHAPGASVDYRLSWDARVALLRARHECDKGLGFPVRLDRSAQKPAEPLPEHDLAPGIPRQAQHEVIVTWPDGTRELWLTDPDLRKIQGQIDAEMKNHPPGARTQVLPSPQDLERWEMARKWTEEAERKRKERGKPEW